MDRVQISLFYKRIPTHLFILHNSPHFGIFRPNGSLLNTDMDEKKERIFIAKLNSGTNYHQKTSFHGCNECG